MTRIHMFALCLLGSLQLFCCAAASSQSVSPQLFAEMMQSLRQVQAYSYHYSIGLSYPTGEQEQLTGDVFCDAASTAMLNKSSMGVTLLTDQWYMAAMHQQKTLVIYSIPKMLEAEKRKPDDLKKEFRDVMTNGLPDSLMISLGKLEKSSIRQSIAHLELSFPEQYHIRRLEVNYDKDAHLPESIVITAFYPQDQTFAGKKIFQQKGTLQQITCSNYKKNVSPAVFATAPYFTVGAGKKISLLQFKEYQLKTNL